jgi:hypothetical protein
VTKPKYVLCLVAGDDGELFLHADSDGLNELIARLEAVRKQVDVGVCGHSHLMTDAWGGKELSENQGIQKGKVVQHLKIFGWTGEWIIKHGFKK